MGDTKGVIKIS